MAETTKPTQAAPPPSAEKPSVTTTTPAPDAKPASDAAPKGTETATTATGAAPATPAGSPKAGKKDMREKFAGLHAKAKERFGKYLADLAVTDPEWASASELLAIGSSTAPTSSATNPAERPAASEPPAHIDWPSDPVARACLFLAAFFDGLTYSEMLRLVEALVPPPPPEVKPAGPDGKTEIVVPQPRPPLDLTPSFAPLGLRRQTAADGRHVIGFPTAGRDRQVRQWFLDEQFGYVFTSAERLLGRDAALGAAPRVRLPLARLLVSLMEGDDTYAAETTRRVLLAADAVAGQSPELTSTVVLGATVDFVRQVWEAPRLRDGLLKQLGLASARKQTSTLVGVLGLSSFIPAAERSQLLRRAASAGDGDDRHLIARDLWWRITTAQEGAAEFLHGLTEWARELGPDGKATEFGAWALHHLRRMVLSTVVEATLQSTLYVMLTGQGQPEEDITEGLFDLVTQTETTTEAQAAHHYALAALCDASAEADSGFPANLVLATALDGKPVLAWTAGLLAAPPAAPVAKAALSAAQWAWAEVLGCRADGPELAGLVLPTEFFWRIGLGADAAAKAAGEQLAQSLRRCPPAYQKALRTFLSLASPAFQGHLQTLASFKEQSTNRAESLRWTRVRAFVQSKAQAVIQLRRALG